MAIPIIAAGAGIAIRSAVTGVRALGQAFGLVSKSAVAGARVAGTRSGQQFLASATTRAAAAGKNWAIRQAAIKSYSTSRGLEYAVDVTNWGIKAIQAEYGRPMVRAVAQKYLKYKVDGEWKQTETAAAVPPFPVWRSTWEQEQRNMMKIIKHDVWHHIREQARKSGAGANQ